MPPVLPVGLPVGVLPVGVLVGVLLVALLLALGCAEAVGFVAFAVGFVAFLRAALVAEGTGLPLAIALVIIVGEPRLSVSPLTAAELSCGDALVASLDGVAWGGNNDADADRAQRHKDAAAQQAAPDQPSGWYGPATVCLPVIALSKRLQAVGAGCSIRILLSHFPHKPIIGDELWLRCENADQRSRCELRNRLARCPHALLPAGGHDSSESGKYLRNR